MDKQFTTPTTKADMHLAQMRSHLDAIAHNPVAADLHYCGAATRAVKAWFALGNTCLTSPEYVEGCLW